MQNTYQWRIIPQNLPTVLKNCEKCGNHSEFECSQNFRINANQSNIDIWLIYQCKKCKTTWNMEIESRIHAGTIDKELYSKYLQNDHALAEQYAFDVSAHNRNKSELNYDNISYSVIGENVNLYQTSETVHIKFVCDVPMEVRVDKILSNKLGVSREIIKKMIREGSILGEGIKDIAKAKAKNGMIITIKA